MNEEFHQEQIRLNKVIETITQELMKVEEKTLSHRKEVVEIRKHFWEDVKVNTDTFDDYLETIISLRQGAQALSVKESTHRHAFNKLKKLRRMKEVPYFGRIDFLEEGTEEAEKIYIGISTLTDKSGEKFLVYDWRAPVASVYYDYPPGEAKYETPEGKIQGILEKKWQYIIRNGVLQAMFDTSLTIGDEILQQVLGKNADKRMHSIVATIQQEQNGIIRHDRGRLLIVHGAAGSGKTSAALQRIAYLLYKYRERIRADQIILFSPNKMFNHYVANVLPELGEENMQQVTFQEYLDRRLSREFEVEGPYEQLEYMLTGKKSSSYETRIESIRFKASTRFFNVIKNYRQSLEISGLRFKGIKFRGNSLITAKEITDRFYGSNTSLKFHGRLEKLADWLNKQIDEAEKIEKAKPWVDEEIELLSKEEYQKVYAYLEKKDRVLNHESFDDYETEKESLAKVIIRRKFKPLRKWIRNYRFVDIKGTYRQLFANPNFIKQWTGSQTPKKWEDICQLTVNMLEEGRLLYEDATPFLFLKELILGFQINGSIKFVLVDEGQDYSPFQFEFLKRLFPSAKMTVLGDFNQAIFAHSREVTDFHFLKELYGPDETYVWKLRKSYRSTKPIIEFTRELLPDGKEIIPFERNGERPVLTQVSNRDELHRSITVKIEELQKRQYNTIAIICKSAAESQVAYNALKSINGIKLMKSNSTEYEQGVVVIPVYLAKGIEFDAVIIYNASVQVYGDESHRRLLYTACTRAMHYLQLYSLGEVSPFLHNLPKERFLLSSP